MSETSKAPQIIIATSLADIKSQPMKVMDNHDKRAMKEYRERPVKETHTQEELEAVYRAARYTKQFLQAESNERMSDKELNSLLKDL